MNPDQFRCPRVEDDEHARRPQTSLALQPEPTRDELLQALALDQFEPYFQPKADLRTGVIHAAVALARWRHPQRGLVPPDAFIALMEHHGLIDRLTEQMVKQSAAAWRTWADAGQHYRISINLSLLSLAAPGYADGLSDSIEAHGIAPRYIVFELSESAAMSDLPHSLENLARLRMKGYGLAIDNYGTGYSSMRQLLRIPFSELKLDRSFVTGASQDNAQVLVLASSLALAGELRLESVAEGVESGADWDLLRRLGCHYAQGYLIGKPVPGAEFAAGVTAWGEAYAALTPELRGDRGASTAPATAPATPATTAVAPATAPAAPSA